MHVLMMMVIIGFSLIVTPAEAESVGKWMKRAPFPEASEELVGASAGGKLYVFGGMEIVRRALHSGGDY